MQRTDKERAEQQSALLRKLLAQGGEIRLTQKISSGVEANTITTVCGEFGATTTVKDKDGNLTQFTTPQESPGVVTVNIQMPKMGKR